MERTKNMTNNDSYNAEALNKRSMHEVQLNVKDYGAYGDGEKDDTRAIQLAIDSLETGGIIFFPAGHYKISSSINVKPNRHLVGSGKNVTMIEWDVEDVELHSNSTMLRFEQNTSESTSSIRNLSLNQKRKERGLKDDQTYGGIGARNNVIIENVRIHNTVGPGISRAGAFNIKIRNCEIYDTGHHPIYFSTTELGYVRDILIENCYLGTPADIEGRHHGANIFKLRFSNAGDRIENVIFRDNKTGAARRGSAIFISTKDGDQQCELHGFRVERNLFNFNKELSTEMTSAIYLAANSKTTKVTVAGNVMVADNKEAAIRFLSDSNDSALIENNKIEGFGRGITLRKGEAKYRGKIKENRIMVKEYGIVSCHDFDVKDNEIFLDEERSVGIYRCTNANIIGNVIRFGTTTSTIGIELSDGIGNYIMNNSIINAFEGIKRPGSRTLSSCFIKDNTFIQCSNRYSSIVNDTDTMKNNVFESSLKDRHGTTANRPTPHYIGERYFDTTINKPIWWTGIEWVDALGIEV